MWFIHQVPLKYLVSCHISSIILGILHLRLLHDFLRFIIVCPLVQKFMPFIVPRNSGAYEEIWYCVCLIDYRFLFELMLSQRFQRCKSISILFYIWFLFTNLWVAVVPCILCSTWTDPQQWKPAGRPRENL